MRNKWVFLLLTGLWCSCSSPPVKNQMVYVQLTPLLDSLCNSLQKNAFTLLKKVNYAGREEMVMQMNPEWKKELEPFFDGEISTPAYAGAYTVDTVLANDSVLYRYQTNEQKIPVKSLRILYTDGHLTNITIRIEKSNAWFLLEQELSLSPADGYSITGKQDMAMGEEVTFTIAGRFMKKDATIKK